MSELTLEERVDALEQQVAQIISGSIEIPHKKDWRRSLGMFAGDETMNEIFAAGAAIRDAERRKARREAKLQRTKANARRTTAKSKRTVAKLEENSQKLSRTPRRRVHVKRSA